MDITIADLLAAEDRRQGMEALIGQGLFPCLACPGEPQLSKSKIKKHYTIAHLHLTEECSRCFNRFFKSDIEKHGVDYHGIQGRPQIFYLCVHCYASNQEPFSFAAENKMQGHNATKHKAFKHECVGCGNVFATKKEANSHCK